MKAAEPEALQKRWLAVATVSALAIGILFTRPYLELIIISAIAAYLFSPIYARLAATLNQPGLAAILTLVISLLTIIIPFCLLGMLTVAQIEELLSTTTTAETANSINRAVPEVINTINQALSSVGIAFQLTAEQLAGSLQHLIEAIGRETLTLLTSSISSLFSFFTLLVLYCFVFINLLCHQHTVLGTISRLNILGEDLGRLYAQKIGAMTKAAIRGQFIIGLALVS